MNNSMPADPTNNMNIMIIEDNETMRLGMRDSLTRDGHHVFDFSNGPEALQHLRKQQIHIVITDLKMTPMDGLAVLAALKPDFPEIEIIMVSAFGTVETAVKALQQGAVDFLTKPFSPEELRVRVKKVVEKINNRRKLNQLSDENLYLRATADAPFENMIGQSGEMQKIFELIKKVAREESTILIQGESGTGKELVARAIHRLSRRFSRPFISINAAALPENLLESELFGHEKGAFTGAVRQKKGRFELANGGTIFLDEIGDISPALQVKLLRVLQEQKFERIGGERTIAVDVRILTATHQNLRQMVQEKRFREDLYYRLNVIPIHLPALRERTADIPLLVNHFLQQSAKKRPDGLKTIDEFGMKALCGYHWPGNIRELENFIERMCVISHGANISSEIIQHSLKLPANGDHSSGEIALDDALFKFEKQMIESAMRSCNGVKNQAAKKLGIKTSALYYKLEKFGLL